MSEHRSAAEERSATSEHDAFRRVEREAWETTSLAYRDCFAPILGPAAERLVERLAPGPGGRLLDVATGPGWVAAAAAARGAMATGVDISSLMVVLASSLLRCGRVVQADAEALPFPPGSFDVTVSNLGLTHVARPGRMVAEMARVTVAGGHVALTTHDEPGATALVGLVDDAAAEAGVRRPPALPPGPSVFHHGYPGDDLFAQLLEAAGLLHVEVGAIAMRHRTTASDLWDMLSRGSTSVALLLRHQSVESRRRLEAAFARVAMRYGAPDAPEALDVPISIKLVVGTR